jgi:bacterial/archaeal transporter family-2 protein
LTPRRSVAWALALASAGGAALALQAYINGRLGTSLGSPEVAAVVNNAVGTSWLVLIATVTGLLPRAIQRIREGSRPRWWHYLASVTGSLFVITGAVAAPKLGIALLTVGLVCGQTVASLAADRFGLSPAGRRPLTAMRSMGVALAVAAVGIGVVGDEGNLHLGLLLLAAVAGGTLALAQAALGQLREVTGDPVTGSGISFAVGGLTSLLVALIATGGSAPGGWSAPPQQWIGGLIGATVVVMMARVVGVLGVLRLTLALVAGQAVGSVLVDVVAPAAGRGVGLRTVVSVALTFMAVAVSGIQRPVRFSR